MNKLKFFLILFIGFSSVAYGQGHSAEIKGSFIQPHLFEKWDDNRWQTEFNDLRQAGMDFIIFMHTVHTDKDDVPRAVYPTSIPTVKPYEKDLLEDCLRNARQANFKVFVGLNFDEKWWNLKPDSVAWLIEDLKQGNDIAAEIVKRYKTRYPETLHGWYWVWEIEPSMCKEQQSKELLVQGLNINLDFLKRLTPDMPVLISPFMNHKLGSSDNCTQVWQYVLNNAHFKDGDIFAPQDCIGSGFLNVDVVEEWFEKLKGIVPEKPHIQFWGNIEMFDQRFWTVAPVGRIIKQIELLKPFVSGYISFAYSHYYSPQLKNPAIHQAYVSYVRSGKMPRTSTPPAVKEIYTDPKNRIITWNPVKKKELMGYHIYKDGTLVADLQLNHDGFCKCQWNYTDNNGKYEVASYNVWGTESAKTEVNIQQTTTLNTK